MSERSGFGLIPGVAWVAAAVVFAALAGGISWFFGGAFGAEFVVVMVMATFASALIVACGYVYGDAKRRGMPALPWAALALFAPNLLGFLLYFLLRKPMAHPCPGCGRGVPPDAAFCPACGAPQASMPVPQPGSAA